MKIRNYPFRGNLHAGLILIAFLSQFWSFFTPGTLTGSISDGSEQLIGASVSAYQNNTLVRGAVTDYNGIYSLQLEEGTYDIVFAYTGFQAVTKQQVKVEAGKVTRLDIVMDNASVLQEVIVTSYKTPLIEQDQTSSGQTLTPEQIKNLPTRSVNTTIATQVGATSIDGGDVNIKGARNNGKDYYIDGNRVSGGTPPVADAKQPKPQPAPKRDLRKEKQITTPQPGTPPASVVSPGPALRDDAKIYEVQGDKTTDSAVQREPVSTEHYNDIVENAFQNTQTNGISTFSIDVDGASYANVRRFLHGGELPPPNAVRMEEMINYFDYQYEVPKNTPHPFAVHTDMGPCPWNPKNRLLSIGIQGAQIDREQLPASNLVFLIDVSGSMGSQNKLPLVKESLNALTAELRANDRVAMVVYAGASGLALESTPGTEKHKISQALKNLESGGGTAGSAGIMLAYETARKNFIPGGNNRVILCTDGDFNVGPSSEDELIKLIEKERESGVYLTVLGFGMGNYQDGKMQSLANKGNGNHAYIDQLKEAQKVLLEEFGGTLFTIAKDVKLQLHFNPQHVAGYRLLGYENRMLATQDFNDDTKDAGELGVGHRVTALYEIIPAGQAIPEAAANSTLQSVQQPDTSVQITANDLMVLQMRYKKPKGNEPSKLLEFHLPASAMNEASTSDNFLLASSIAEFGLLLRHSAYKGSASFEQAIQRAQKAAQTDPKGYRAELVQLMTIAKKLSDNAAATAK